MQSSFIMEGVNYLTSGDLALHSQEMRGMGYDGYGYGCHRSGKGMAATGIGLAAGLGGAALIGVFLAAWGINNASQARAKAAENLAAGNTKAINDFVRERYHSGTLVRADSLMKALVTFKNNPFVINFLRKPPQE